MNVMAMSPHFLGGVSAYKHVYKCIVCVCLQASMYKCTVCLWMYACVRFQGLEIIGHTQDWRCRAHSLSLMTPLDTHNPSSGDLLAPCHSLILRIWLRHSLTCIIFFPHLLQWGKPLRKNEFEPFCSVSPPWRGSPTALNSSLFSPVPALPTPTFHSPLLFIT